MITTKKRWIAMLLSILMTGVGQFYIGKYKKALFILLSPFVLVTIATLLFWKSSFIVITLVLAVLAIYLYGFIDVWRSFPLKEETNLKYSHWYFILLYIIFAFGLQMLFSATVAQSFITPSASMEGTIMQNDAFFIEKKHQIQRGDVVVFKYPVDHHTPFVKRVVAKEGDELIYQDKHLYIHFSEGDEYMLQVYKEEKVLKLNGKLWVDNPYMSKNQNIHYRPKENGNNIFEYLVHFEGIRTDMSPIYIKEFGKVLYNTDSKMPMNAFYKKVEENHYYMIGDNRDNSNDSRFWGSVPADYIIGIAKVVYFNKNDLSRVGMAIH